MLPFYNEFTCNQTMNRFPQQPRFFISNMKNATLNTHCGCAVEAYPAEVGCRMCWKEPAEAQMRLSQSLTRAFVRMLASA